MGDPATPARQLLQPAIGWDWRATSTQGSAHGGPEAMPYGRRKPGQEGRGNQVTARRPRQLWLRSFLFPAIRLFSTELGILRELTYARVSVTPATLIVSRNIPANERHFHARLADDLSQTTRHLNQSSPQVSQSPQKSVQHPRYACGRLRFPLPVFEEYLKRGA